jgi:hypothetical protein
MGCLGEVGRSPTYRCHRVDRPVRRSDAELGHGIEFDIEAFSTFVLFIGRAYLDRLIGFPGL